jgi:ribosomal protein S14
MRRLLTKSVVMDSYATISIRSKLYLATSCKLVHYSITEQRNKCRMSGRSYFVLSRAGLARMPFKFMSGCGLLAGISRRGK